MQKYIVTLFEELIEVLEVPAGADIDKIKGNIIARVQGEFEAEGLKESLGEEAFAELLENIEFNKVTVTSQFVEAGQLETAEEVIDVDVNITIFSCIDEDGVEFPFPDYEIVAINPEDIGKCSKVQADRTNLHGDILTIPSMEQE